MEKPPQILLLLLAFHFLKAASQVFDTTGWLSIDCGSSLSRIGNNLIVWETDMSFIKTGSNKNVQEKQELEEMNTLRFFQDQSQPHCYVLPAYKLTLRYMIRAGFYYGNYDGLSRPPTFDLKIDGKNWTTVNTSSIDGAPVYHEISYVTERSGKIRVRLEQTREEEVPFISSLEAVPLWVNLYPKLTTNATIHLVSRTNFGGPEVRFTAGLFGDTFNRIWTPGTTPSNCREVSTLPDPTLEINNSPPLAAVGYSIESFHISSPITLILRLPSSLIHHHQACFVFYFSDLFITPPTNNGSRITHIFINGQENGTVTFKRGTCKVLSTHPVNVTEPAVFNITLAAAGNSQLPPMISAMEVFAWKLSQSDGGGGSSIKTGSVGFFCTCIILIQALNFMHI